MKRNIFKLLCCCLIACGILAAGNISANEEEKNIYLATFIAKYEYNMGMEHAQFPSGQYTDNYRTDILYYAVSEDGENYTVLNNNKAVLYPLNSVKLGSPSLFRKADGSYGLIAGVDNKSTQIFLSDTEDLVTYTGDRTVELGTNGVNVANPTASYDAENDEYVILWEGDDGKSYKSTTVDFKSFSQPQVTDYVKAEFEGDLPKFADTNEASVFMIDQDEYKTIMNKYGVIKCESVDGLTINVNEGEQITLPERLDVRYTDDSTTSMKVEWDLAGAGVDLNNPKAGTYEIKGTIQGTTEYDNPIGMFRADPYIYYNEDDGYYYFTASYMQSDLQHPYDYVAIKKAKTINEIYDAEEVIIFSGTTMAEHGVDVQPDYWAPEIHKIGGKFRILVQGTVNGGAQQCLLTCNGDDMMDPDAWEYTGYIEKSTPYDMTYLECEGETYYITQTWSSLGIAKFDPENPTKLTRDYVRIAFPDRAYDRNVGTNQDILEGPAVMIHDGYVFLTYSGSTIDMHYCTNLLYADVTSDLMNPASWTKLQIPLFTTADLTTTLKDTVLEDRNGEYEGQMGPGHSNFTIDENGNPVLVYHARDWSEHYATGSNKYGLSDPGRHAYVKSIHFGADGMPIFNMTPEQILSDELRNVTMKVTVKGPETPAPVATPEPQQPVVTPPAGVEEKVGAEVTVGKLKYVIKKVGKNKKVTLVGVKSKKIKAAVIPATVKINKNKYKVTAVGKKAFVGCKKLKKITVKSKNIKKIPKSALKGVKKNVKIKYKK